MKRLTTLALLAGMLSAPALHSEEPGSGSAAPLSFPQLNDAADSERATNLRLPRRRRAPLRQPRHRRRCGGDGPCAGYAGLTPPVSGTAAPEVIPVAPVWGGDLNLAQMGMPDGLSSAAASDRVGSALPCLPIRW